MNKRLSAEELEQIATDAELPEMETDRYALICRLLDHIDALETEISSLRAALEAKDQTTKELGDALLAARNAIGSIMAGHPGKFPELDLSQHKPIRRKRSTNQPSETSPVAPSPMQQRILDYLNEHGHGSPKEISGWVGSSYGATCQALLRLRRKGLVTVLKRGVYVVAASDEESN